MLSVNYVMDIVHDAVLEKYVCVEINLCFDSV